MLWINYSILLQIRKGFFSLPPAFQPPLCCTVSALETEISSPNCGKIVSQESELLSSHLFHFSHHSRHDKWAARVCLSLSLLMAAPLSGVPLSSRKVSFLIHPPLSSTSSTKWPNYIPLRDFQSFHLPFSLMYGIVSHITFNRKKSGTFIHLLHQVVILFYWHLITVNVNYSRMTGLIYQSAKFAKLFTLSLNMFGPYLWKETSLLPSWLCVLPMFEFSWRQTSFLLDAWWLFTSWFI